MNQPPIADIYCRTVANDTETYTKLEQQEIACRAFCEEHGLSVGMVHREVASGITYRERPQLSLLRSRYYQHEIQGLVVTDLHRLSRSQVHLYILMEEIDTYGATLYSVNEQKNGDGVEIFVRTIVNFIAEVEHER